MIQYVFFHENSQVFGNVSSLFYLSVFLSFRQSIHFCCFRIYHFCLSQNHNSMNLFFSFFSYFLNLFPFCINLSSINAGKSACNDFYFFVFIFKTFYILFFIVFIFQFYFLSSLSVQPLNLYSVVAFVFKNLYLYLIPACEICESHVASRL